MYKRISNPSPPIMSRVFKLNSDICCSFRQILQFSRPQVRSVYHGMESIFCLGPNMWDMLPYNYKTIGNLDAFKIKIKKWKLENCPCTLCKMYIDSVGFL